MWIADNDVFALACDDAVPFPCADCAADGVQCRAGHFRQVLTCDGKIDLDPIVYLAS